MKKHKSAIFAIALLGLISSTSGALQVYPRIITPNGDGWNDKVLFQFENPALLPSKGEIFDLTGAKVGELTPGPVADTSLVWDGKKSGWSVPSGIYIYQIEVGNKVVMGTVIVSQ